MAQNRPPFFSSHEKKPTKGYESLSAYIAKKRIAQYEAALSLKDENKLRRIFQLSDYVYSEILPHLAISQTNILLHCSERGNFGDIASALFCAELIKKNRPQCDITILFELMTLDEKTVMDVFQTTAFKVEFTSKDYHIKEKKFEQAVTSSACVLGISVGIGSALLYQKQHRVFHEYGYYWHPDVKNETLGMGLDLSEEGIMIPTIHQRQLNEIKTDWVKSGLTAAATMYHMHRRNWYLQMLSIYQVAILEKNKETDFSIILPLVYPLQNYIDWGILNLDYLKKVGIRQITRFTPNRVEKITLQSSGKEMKILSGPIPKHEMEVIQQYSEPFFGCGGDNTISECIALGKIPYYDGSEQKSWFFDSMITLAKELNLPNLTQMFELLRQLISDISAIYTANTPKKRGFYAPDPSFDLASNDSVPRLSVPKILPKLFEHVEKMSPLCADQALLQEARILSEFIKANLNVEPKLLASVDRGLILGNFPDMIEIEKRMWEQFKAGKIKLDNLHDALRETLSQFEHPKSSPNQKND